ncbi:MAG: carboxyl-terminal processing protease, partial [Bradymonadia bacterium]
MTCMNASTNVASQRRLLFPAVLLGLLVGSIAVTGTAFAEGRNQLNCATLPSLMERYEALHVSARKRDDALMQRVADIYVKRFDPSKSLLLESEARALHAQVLTFFKTVSDGQCALMNSFKTDEQARQAEIQTHVSRVLADPKLKIDRTIELAMDPDKRPRSKTKAERDELRRQLIHFQLANYVSAGTELAEAKTKLNKRYALITKRINERDDGDMYSGLLDAYAAGFDPHTTYFSAEALEDFRIGMGLSLEGIGAVLRSRDGYTIVNEVVKGGAADRQGKLKRKDRIIAVTQVADGKPADGKLSDEGSEPVDVIDMSLRDVVRLIRGKKGTTVRLTLLRQGKKSETLKIDIVRDKIDLKDQAAKVRYETIKRGARALNIAIVDLPSFYGSSRPGGRQCADDMANILAEISQKKVDGVMLDLSSNSGGLLQHSVDITGLFMRRGGVVGVEGAVGPSKVLKDVDQRIQYSGPLVVLTSRLSASASEILAGALRDYDRALIVGDPQTFGKGTVQNVVNLPMGFGALKVTTALFFRPAGQSTQQIGVPAHIVVPSPFNSEQYGEKNQDYSLPSRTTTPFKSKTANIDGPGGFVPITKALVDQLTVKSAARVKANPEFDKIAKDLAKAEARSDMLKIAEILDDDSKKKDDDDDDAPKKDDGKLSVQALEGLQVLADLIESNDSVAKSPCQRPRAAPR